MTIFIVTKPQELFEPAFLAVLAKTGLYDSRGDTYQVINTVEDVHTYHVPDQLVFIPESAQANEQLPLIITALKERKAVLIESADTILPTEVFKMVINNSANYSRAYKLVKIKRP